MAISARRAGRTCYDTGLQCAHCVRLCAAETLKPMRTNIRINIRGRDSLLICQRKHGTRSGGYGDVTRNVRIRIGIVA